MSYAYDSLEIALELAVARVPVKDMGPLISRVEYVIENNQDARALEEELLVLAGINGHKEKAFRLERLVTRTPAYAEAA